ncbi:hypothetical protein JYG23_02615 [Sedimentibacter sp. zth1]|uniref:P-loop ATPase, Sll1717 family n=1 Tax=Sedimentibacter sp. zth1 TaxID=2816908 RepID=UPI001A92A0FA|nr:hypothetical protein [Sedimentibacter sp. zth1]QSX06372.1 hypothetical protein JYG23_02615 [Sedimentibacter sp. zth1]
MVEKAKLVDLYLGDIDGETEVAKCKNFYNLFYCQKEVIDSIINGDKYVIIGRKGTGKTLLAHYVKKKIDEQSTKFFCKVCGSNEINLQKLLEIGDSTILINQYETYWEYTIYTLIANIILENTSKLVKILPSYTYRILKKFVENKTDSFKIIDYVKKSNSDNKIGASLNNITIATKLSRGTDVRYAKARFFDKLKRLKKLIFKQLKDNRVILIIDELDCLNISTKMDKNYIKCISSLLNTSKKINNEFSNENFKSKIIILLRDDIITYLNENDSNTNKSICCKDIVLDWWDTVDYNFPYKHPLMKMILLKIKNSNSYYKNKTDKEIYKTIFPKHVAGKDVLTYLLDNSFGRPRDIISYLNIIRDKEKSSTTFDPKYFKMYKRYYYKSFFNELKNEISIHENAPMLNDALKLLRDYKKTSFLFREIEDYFENNKEYYTNIDNLKEAIRCMYYQGILGNLWTRIVTNVEGTTTKKSYISWYYKTNLDPEPYPNFSNKFIVHKALLSNLSIRN